MIIFMSLFHLTLQLVLTCSPLSYVVNICLFVCFVLFQNSLAVKLKDIEKSKLNLYISGLRQSGQLVECTNVPLV